MTGFDHIVRAIAVFEGSLLGEPSDPPIQTVTELARRTGYSVHHFTRLFSAVVGIPPKEYLLGRALTEAAQSVAETSAPLRSIAERVGFQDYETFSRAFKRQFGMPPSRLRESGRMPSGGTRRAAPVRPRPSRRLPIRDPEVIHVDEFHVAGLAFFVEEGTPSFHQHWEAFMRVQDRVRDQVSPVSFLQVSSWPETEALSGLAVLCALQTEGLVEQEPLFTLRTIPAGDFLRFLHPGDVSTIRDTYEFIYRDYLARHDIRAESSWEFQRYADDGTIEIHIPFEART